MVERALEVAERVRFADLLAEVGPDAPTLCEGWTAKDLAAHMVVIEHPEAWAGGGSARKFALTNALHDRVMDAERAKPWRDQVSRVRGGPLHPGPFTWRAVRERMYIREYLVHHEDLRRANDLKPRTGIPELQEVGWTKATTVGKFALKRADLPEHCGISLVRNDTGESFAVRPGPEVVEVRGEPIELLLFALGRRSAADVDLTGRDDVLSELAAGSWAV